MEGFLRVDTSLVTSIVGVMFWDKLSLVRRMRERKRSSFPVSKWKTLGETIQTYLEHGVWTQAENREKIDSVYVWEFWRDVECVLISVNAVHCAFFAGISVQFNGEHIRCCKSVLESDTLEKPKNCWLKWTKCISVFYFYSILFCPMLKNCFLFRTCAEQVAV